MGSHHTRAVKPFEFLKSAYLVEVMPLRAASLGELLTGITLAPDKSIYFHLHQRFFHDPQRLPEFPNDFAAWADAKLGNSVVAERLANLNLFRSVELEVVRREISVILAEHLQQNHDKQYVSTGHEFIFCQPRLVSFSSQKRAGSPEEFVKILHTIDSSSIGYHLFEPKSLPGHIENDFANWFRQLGHEGLAEQLDAFDPYLNSLEDNRAYLIELIQRGLKSSPVGATDD